jgi:hypothetical protein
MAVGIVVGAAFTDLVKAFVSDWITPLVGCAPAASWQAPMASCLLWFLASSSPECWHLEAMCALGGCRVCWVPARATPACAQTSDRSAHLQIGAIFSGGNFNDLTFSVNGSLFFYGHFINVKPLPMHWAA